MTKSELEKEIQKLKKENIYLIRFRYSKFGALTFIKFPFIFLSLLFIILFNKISYIHTWCTPAGAIGYLLSLITEKKLILDSYEPHAEAMVENGTWNKESLKFKLLFWLEKKQLQCAEKIITCVKEMKTYVKDKFNFDLKNYYTKPSCVDFTLFNTNCSNKVDPKIKLALENKIVGIYVGKFGGIYLKEEVFEFIKKAEDYWGKDNFRFIILSSHSSEFIKKLAQEVNINAETIIHLFVPFNEVPHYMSLANFGVSPILPVPSKRYCSPIKNSEYMAMGLPIIITKNISDDSEIIEKNGFGYVLQNLNAKEYLAACKKIDSLIKNKKIKQQIINYALTHRNYNIAENIYKTIYQ